MIGPGGKATLTITVKIAEGFHIYSPQPGDEYAIPTTFTPLKTPGVTYGKPVWPKATKFEKTNVFEGQATITAEAVAQAAGTIPYEILTGLNQRIPRVYHTG